MYMQKPENSGIGKWLLDANFDFTLSNEHETYQVCSLNRPISLKKGFDKVL